MKYPLILVISSFTFLTMSLSAHADKACPISDLPPLYEVNQVSTMVGIDFEVTDGKKKYGEIQQRKARIRSTFEYRNAKNELISYAEKSKLSWGNEIIVYDCNKKKIGSFHEENLKSTFSSVYTQYSIYDENGNKKGKSEKVGGDPEFTLTTITGTPIAKVSKPLSINPSKVWHDHWQVQDFGILDKRMIPFVGTFRTLASSASVTHPTKMPGTEKTEDGMAVEIKKTNPTDPPPTSLRGI